MKIAVLGPMAKDKVNIDGVEETYLGGIPYYEACALSALGIDVEAYVTYSKKDEDLVRRSLSGIKVHPIYTDKTITHELSYRSKEPDMRNVEVVEYDSSVFPVDDTILEELRKFDYIILGPLYYENIPYEFFEKMKGSNLILNNFGIFTYLENNIPVKKNRENLSRVAPFIKYLFLDEEEIKFGSDKNTLEDSAEYFLDLGITLVVVTLGSKGSVIFTKEEKHIIPAFPPKELIDPTGAGDTYVAGFIASEKIFTKLEDRGRFSAMVATMGIETKGAFRKSCDEVLERLKKEN